MILFHWMFDAVADEGYLPKAASTLASGVDDTFMFIWWCCVVFFIALMGAMFYFVVAYKQKDENEKTLDLKGHHTLELVWSIFPSFLLIAMFVMGFQQYVRSTIPPAEALQVSVIGKKWDWTFAYPTLGTFTSRDLVVPNQEPVRLEMISQDVLHSFFVPDFRMKKDVLPNRYTTQWFETTEMYEPQEGDKFYSYKFSFPDAEPKEGSTDLYSSAGQDVKEAVASQCAKEKKNNAALECSTDATQIKVGLHQVFCTEYCGDSHSRMLAKVVVLSPVDFDLWVKSQNNFDPDEKFKGNVSALGEYYAGKAGCTACHSNDGAVKTGPTWKGLWDADRKFADGSTGKANADYIRESILYPQAKVVEGFPAAGMPANLHKAFGQGKEEAGILAIIEYIKTLQ